MHRPRGGDKLRILRVKKDQVRWERRVGLIWVRFPRLWYRA